MYADQVNEKLKAEQAYTANRIQNTGAGQARPYGGQVSTQTCEGQIGRAVQVPLREQLEKRGATIADQHGRIGRALDILNRHPEFEEFLQLQEILGSGLYY